MKKSSISKKLQNQRRRSLSKKKKKSKKLQNQRRRSLSKKKKKSKKLQKSQKLRRRSFSKKKRKSRMSSANNNQDKKRSQMLSLDENYWYTDEDINDILEARLNELPIRDHIFRGSAIGLYLFLDSNESTIAAIKLLIGNLDANVTHGVLPLNVNGNHWIGLVFIKEGDHYRVIISDSLRDSPINMNLLRQILRQAFNELNINDSNVTFVIDSESIKQNDRVSCGPLTIENIIRLLGGEHMNGSIESGNIDIRIYHGEIVLGPDSDIVNMKKDEKRFNMPSEDDIINLKNYWNQLIAKYGGFTEEAQTHLANALKKLGIHTKNRHKKFLKNLYWYCTKSGCIQRPKLGEKIYFKHMSKEKCEKNCKFICTQFGCKLINKDKEPSNSLTEYDTFNSCKENCSWYKYPKDIQLYIIGSLENKIAFFETYPEIVRKFLKEDVFPPELVLKDELSYDIIKRLNFIFVPQMIENYLIKTKRDYEFYLKYYKSLKLKILTIENYFNRPLLLGDCSNLQILNFGTNTGTNVRRNVSDISILASCTNLQTLDISGTNVSDISPLTSCTNLQTLNLSFTSVNGDISPLASCTNLETLELNNTRVTDISALAYCSNLESLELNSTDVTYISILANCCNLRTLDLNHTSVNDISVLADCSKLETLEFCVTPVNDISALADCSNLETLGFSYTSVDDISALEHKYNLVSLDIEETAVTDITPLIYCTNLQSLNIQDTPVTAVSINIVLQHIPRLSIGRLF